MYRIKIIAVLFIISFIVSNETFAVKKNKEFSKEAVNNLVPGAGYFVCIPVYSNQKKSILIINYYTLKSYFNFCNGDIDSFFEKIIFSNDTLLLPDIVMAELNSSIFSYTDLNNFINSNDSVIFNKETCTLTKELSSDFYFKNKN